MGIDSCWVIGPECHTAKLDVEKSSTGHRGKNVCEYGVIILSNIVLHIQLMLCDTSLLRFQFSRLIPDLAERRSRRPSRLHKQHGGRETTIRGVERRGKLVSAQIHEVENIFLRGARARCGWRRRKGGLGLYLGQVLGEASFAVAVAAFVGKKFWSTEYGGFELGFTFARPPIVYFEDVEFVVQASQGRPSGLKLCH